VPGDLGWFVLWHLDSTPSERIYGRAELLPLTAFSSLVPGSLADFFSDPTQDILSSFMWRSPARSASPWDARLRSHQRFNFSAGVVGLACTCLLLVSSDTPTLILWL